MSGAVREVLIRLKLQADGLKIGRPDTSEFQAEVNRMREYAQKQLSVPAQLSRGIAPPAVSAPGQSVQAGGFTSPSVNPTADLARQARAQTENERAGMVTQAAGNSVNVPSRLDKRLKGFAEAAAEERAARAEEQRIMEEAANRNKKFQLEEKKQLDRALKEKNEFSAQRALAAEKAEAAEERRQERAAMRARANRPSPGMLSRDDMQAQAAQLRPQSPGVPSLNIDTSLGQTGQQSRAFGNPQALQQAGDAAKQAGEGAFHLARGIIFLTASSEDEIAVLVKKIAYYQGLFDIVKGGIDVTSGLVKGTRALAAAQATGAAAQALSNGSMGGLQVAALGGRGALMAMAGVLTGPVAIGLAATAVGAGVAWLAYDKMTGTTKRWADEAKKAADVEVAAMRKRITAINDLAAVQRSGESAQARFNRVSELRANYNAGVDRGFLDQIRKLEADQKADRERNIKGLLASADKAAGKKDYLGQATGFAYQKDPTAQSFLGANNGNYTKLLEQINKSNPLGDVASGRDQIAKTLAATKDQASAQKAITEWKEREAKTAPIELAHRKNLTDAVQREVGFTRERLGLLTKELDQVKGIAAAQAAATKAAQDRKKSIEADKLTDLQKFGQMNQYEQFQAKQISEKLAAADGDVQGAGLHEGQIQFMRDKGLGASALEKYDLNKARESGGEKVLENFGQTRIGEIEAKRTGLPEGEKREDVATMQQQFASAEARIARDREKQLQQIMKETRDEEAKLIKVLTENDPRIEALQNAIKDRDAYAAELQSDLAKSLEATKRAAVGEAKADSDRRAMHRIPTGF